TRSAAASASPSAAATTSTTAPATAAAAVAPTAASAPTTALSGEAWYGVSGPFSGANAEYGRIWKQAMAMALDEINGSGGVKGRKAQLDEEDTQSDPKQSVPVAQKFVEDSRMLAELGDFSSPSSMAASPIYERARMVQFGFTNSHPDFTKGGEFMFSIVLTQEQDASFLAQTAFDGLGKVQAVLYQNTDWGKTTQQIYVDKIKSLGGQIVHTDNYLTTEKDFTPILSKVRDAKPEVLALISYYNDGAQIVQQAKNMGLNVKIVANGACYSPQFLKLGGDATNGVLMTTVFFPDNPRPEVKKFVSDYTTRFKETPDQFAALSYDAVKIITWATEQGGFDRVAIQKAMATGTEIPSVIYGPFKFGADRRVENARAVPIQVKDGQFVAYKPAG
ncbi:MAG: ABC transporter substrate-binding protein, partial [Chloroflexota bacterium]